MLIIRVLDAAFFFLFDSAGTSNSRSGSSAGPKRIAIEFFVDGSLAHFSVEGLLDDKIRRYWLQKVAIRIDLRR